MGKNMKRTVKIILSIMIPALLLGTVIIPSIVSKPINTKSVEKSFRNELKGAVVILDSNSPYDYGFKAGKRFRQEYRLFEIIARLKSNIDKKMVEKQIGIMERHYPFFLEELRGLSDSLSIQLEKVVSCQMSLHSIFDKLLNEECTMTLSSGKSTKNNITFLTLNVDSRTDSMVNKIIISMLRLFTMKPRIARVNTLCYKYVYFGIPVLYEWPLMNEKGLGFCATGLPLTENDSRYIDEGEGVSTYMLERLTLMTCKNVSEVARLWKSIERSSGPDESWPHFWDNSASGWCDREGGILIIEQTHNHIITVFGNSTEITGGPEGILWHANHHQWLDPNLTGSKFPDEYESSKLRAERARELLETNYGMINYGICKKITRDYKGGSNPDDYDSSDICRYPDEDYPAGTVFSWIIQPESLTIFWTHSVPNKSRFYYYNFSTIFDGRDSSC